MSAQSTISREKTNVGHNTTSNYCTITNSTSEQILVYGPPKATDGGKYDTSWYVLHTGKTTPQGWECFGFFVPKDRSFSNESDSTIEGPVAIKYSGGKSITLTSSQNKYIAKGANYDGVFHQSEINWSIPDFSCEDCQAMNKLRYEIDSDLNVMKQNKDYEK
ncbi:hypothetical protein [Clostridium sp. 'White wine YQ']|uniref:hypothetical protein n=1 Tax=Clostridium sp. 'White wine YQ' TaxID=3027474 RepID=UPI0023650E91|nr:hypothetical protein [Clostridium sp. 'White wine YQ']MDD7794162.1 hypothetical protein [Clostridium sp. 'White wine YQ']